MRLTAFDDDQALLNSIMAGAAGYALKQIRGSDLVGTVRTVAFDQPLLNRSPLIAVGRCCCRHRCCQLTLSGGQRVTKVPRRHGDTGPPWTMPRTSTN